MLKPHRDWSCNSIWEAYENYWWPIPGGKEGFPVKWTTYSWTLSAV